MALRAAEPVGHVEAVPAVAEPGLGPGMAGQVRIVLGVEVAGDVAPRHALAADAGEEGMGMVLADPARAPKASMAVLSTRVAPAGTGYARAAHASGRAGRRDPCGRPWRVRRRRASRHRRRSGGCCAGTATATGDRAPPRAPRRSRPGRGRRSGPTHAVRPGSGHAGCCRTDRAARRARQVQAPIDHVLALAVLRVRRRYWMLARTRSS